MAVGNVLRHSSATFTLITLIWVIGIFCNVESFSQSPVGVFKDLRTSFDDGVRNSCHTARWASSRNELNDPFDEGVKRVPGEPHCPSNGSLTDRRQFLQFSSTAIILGGTRSCAASEEEVATANLDCLLDLPPVSRNCVRLYLCRHGQTENNRLRRVQGARVDPPLNNNGEAMAETLGMAFARLNEENIPHLIMHSNMLRATQTAQIASKQIPTSTQLETLPLLTEVDFGPALEGKKVAQVRADMARTYGAWSTGFIDTRPEDGGESGREVLNRAVDALSMLEQGAVENGGSIIAVSHSTYLRMLLAVLLDVSLAQVATLAQANGGINVIDIDTTGREKILGPKCKLFGGLISQAPSDFELRVKPCKVIRLNENRHLQGIL